ncbi:MAG TPA: hypothetical protein VHS03_02050 [Gaiellaceae bacterium]|nr:hypothetical protein [Gaiellaceae bacterium]
MIGLHRSGSSCLAGVLHNLGVHMGEMLTGYEPTGGFEAAELMAICESVYPFPSTEPALPQTEIVATLRRYVAKVCTTASDRGNQLAGGKYPQLCAMGAALQSACGEQLRLVHIDRPLEESIASLKERSRKATGFLAAGDAEIECLQRWLWHEKQQLLGRVSHVDVTFADLLAAPRREVERVAAWLEITPSEEAVAKAVAHVRPRRVERSSGPWRRALST